MLTIFYNDKYRTKFMTLISVFSYIGKVLIDGLMLSLVLLLLMLIGIMYYFSFELPNYRQLVKCELPITTTVYSNNGDLLNKYYYEDRVLTSIDKIPQELINAFIAAEDKSFYFNNGIDIMSMVRAVFINIYNVVYGQRLIGASTITQQLVKNCLLTPDRTLERKIQEIILSVRVSSKFSKKQVMELYLNKIYFGAGSYGIVSAASTYFNKTIYQLNLAEMALLAALPKAPSKLNPFINKTSMLDRRNWVIDRMLEEGFISGEEAFNAQNTPIDLHSNKIESSAHFFLDEIKKILVDKYDEHDFYTKGFSIHSTLDHEYQKIAEQSLVRGLKKYDKNQGWRGAITNIDVQKWPHNLREIQRIPGMKDAKFAVILSIVSQGIKIGLASGEMKTIDNPSWAHNRMKIGDVILVSKWEDKYYVDQVPEVNGALVVMEVKTGRILAMAGGYDYDISQFNIATQAKRQLGSVLKPFIYLAALENHFTPSTVINDEKIEIKQGPLMPFWQPRNFENRFFGPNSLREALELSHNVTTVHIARAVGIKKIADLAHRFNLYNGVNLNYSVVLGATEATLLELLNAYAILANNGVRVKPQFIDSIADREGNELFKREDLPPQYVTNSSSAYQVISMLEGAATVGTAKRIKPLNITVAAKTGTSNDSKDAWFVAVTPEIAVGVYVGFDQPKPLGGRLSTAARIALPICHEFMKNIDLIDMPFPVPPTVQFTRLQGGDNKHDIWEAFQVGTAPH